MKKVDFWTLFLETGAPEFYLLYRKAPEHGNSGGDNYVSQDTGPGPQRSGVQ